MMPADEHHQVTSPLGRPLTVVLATVAGMLLIFVVLGLMLRISQSAPAIDPGDKAPYAVLQKLQSDDRRALTAYGWVDRKNGVVRIPIDVAMEKLIAEHEQSARQK